MLSGGYNTLVNSIFMSALLEYLNYVDDDEDHLRDIINKQPKQIWQYIVQWPDQNIVSCLL